VKVFGEENILRDASLCCRSDSKTEIDSVHPILEEDPNDGDKYEYKDDRALELIQPSCLRQERRAVE
jgi:hypothetical protein